MNEIVTSQNNPIALGPLRLKPVLLGGKRYTTIATALSTPLEARLARRQEGHDDRDGWCFRRRQVRHGPPCVPSLSLGHKHSKAKGRAFEAAKKTVPLDNKRLAQMEKSYENL
jgi:hypothetical protein